MITTMIWACSKADAFMVHHPQVQVQLQVSTRILASRIIAFFRHMHMMSRQLIDVEVANCRRDGCEL